MSSLRVTSIDPRLTRLVRSWAWANERAHRVALLAGSAEIQQRQDGAWTTVQRFVRTADRVSRQEVR